MKRYISLALLLLCTLNVQADILEDPPEGYSVVEFTGTGGRALKPDSWFFEERYTESHAMFVVSKAERPISNGYKTGMKVILYSEVSSRGGPPEGLAKVFIDRFSKIGRVLELCEPEQVGLVTRQCLEKEEPSKNGGVFRVTYSFMWWDDFLAIVVSGAPKEEWKDVEEIFSTIGEIEPVNVERLRSKI